MDYIERKATDSSHVKVVRNPVECEGLLPIGYYTCSDTGNVTHIVDSEEENDGIMIWVYSEKLFKFCFTEKTVRMPIVIRKGNDLYYASFRNFEYVYKNVCEDTGVFTSVEKAITLFDPEMYKYTIRISVHSTNGKHPFTHPWMFYKDVMKRSKINPPSESARKALNVSYEINIGNKVKSVYFYLFYMGGSYYCRSLSEVDPMLSKEDTIRGYKLSKLSDEKVTIRYKENDRDVAVIGGYYDPKRYKKLMYYLAEKYIPDKEMRRRFYQRMRNHKLRTYTIYRKYPELTDDALLNANAEAKKTYTEDLKHKIRIFLKTTN